MTWFKSLHLLYIVLIILALIASPTPMGISKNGGVGLIIQTLFIVLLVMFFASLEFMSKKEKDFLEKYNHILKYVLVPYMLLTMWAIWTVKVKLIGSTLSGGINAF